MRKVPLVSVGPTNTVTNAHSIMKEQLEAHLNRHTNLAQIIHILNETFQPLTSISKLPSIPQLCVHAVSARAYLPIFGSDLRINSSLQRPRVPVQTFTIMPQCVTLVRIAYQGMYCLELRLRGGGLVSLRDGAYSRFDRSNVVDEFTPTQGLKVRDKKRLRNRILKEFEIIVFVYHHRHSCRNMSMRTRYLEGGLSRKTTIHRHLSLWTATVLEATWVS